MPLIEILNPQDPILKVQSNFTVIGGVEIQLDLNEDSWATDYFVVFFHSGPGQWPAATPSPPDEYRISNITFFQHCWKIVIGGPFGQSVPLVVPPSS